MTVSNQLFGRVIRVKTNGLTFTNDNLEIRFTVPFDDDPKPNVSKIEIFNLSNDTINRIKRGATCTIEAGYRGDVGVIAIGKITSVLTRREGVDKITTITVMEGDDYSRIKVDKKNSTDKKSLKITFKKGTEASVIIKRLCSVLGIKLAYMKLPKDVVYKNGYTVTGLILNNLEEVVRDCGASMYYRRGQMVIRSIKEGTDERFILKEDTGLIESPEPFEEEGIKGYKVKCLLQHRITTASIIEIQSKTAKGKYRARKGEHRADGNDFITEFEVI
ncbi:hypothetical protein P9848_05645 [Geobacillus stearothermophilus]|uniref:phage protein n=1 Tax=Geobacillus stearothermophilus TaxID=1422 RepID=UPI002E20BEFB|nr:hypothetical protein [Geobacillus stearothermophilus]